MHVLHRPHLPRLITVSIAAAIVAIVISLALASTVSNVGQPAESPSTSAHPTAPARAGALRATPAGWASNPFAGPLLQPWLTDGR
jgi:hypothetical protein